MKIRLMIADYDGLAALTVSGRTGRVPALRLKDTTFALRIDTTCYLPHKGYAFAYGTALCDGR